MEVSETTCFWKAGLAKIPTFTSSLIFWLHSVETRHPQFLTESPTQELVVMAGA